MLIKRVTPEDLLAAIRKCGSGQIEEFKLLHMLDISHGKLWQLRHELEENHRRWVRHYNHKPYYTILNDV